MIWRSLSVPLLAALTLTLGACAPAFLNTGIENKGGPIKEPGVWMNLEVLSLINTRKTIVDHIATWVTGRDCSTVRAQRDGAYCVDWPSDPVPPQQVYCYSTLARPTCYAHPYNEGNDHLIGFVPASAPMR